MGNEKQLQKAGDNSQQVQADVVNVTNNYIMGIDEKRVREVCSEMALEAIKSCTQEATETALARIENFTTTLVPRIEKIEKDFHSFSEPSFQFLLQSAQKTAACTEREVDYEMLSELLVHRIEKKTERKTTTSIAKAIEIVDQIDDDALCGMTIVHTMCNIFPVNPNIRVGINALGDLYDSLLYTELPKGGDWLEHLSILNAIRTIQYSGTPQIEHIFEEKLSGYYCIGIKKDSENYSKALEIIENTKLPNDILVENELLEDFVKIPIVNKSQISQLGISTGQSWHNITENEIQAVKQIISLYSNDYNLKNDMKNNFMLEWNKYESLQKIAEWWNKIPQSFNITSIGCVLSHANAQRYNSKIPNLN